MMAVVKDSAGNSFPVQKIMMVSAVEKKNNLYEFSIHTPHHRGLIYSISKSGIMRKFNAVRNAIWRHDSAYKKFLLHDQNDLSTGFIIPLWAIEYVGKLDMKTLSFPIGIGAHGIPSTFTIKVRYGPEERFKTLEDARASVKGIHAILKDYL